MKKIGWCWKRLRGRGLLVAVVGMGMLGVFGGLLTACETGTAPAQQAQQAQPSAYQTTMKTSDGRFLVQFRVTPNRQGLNTFVVVPTTSSGGKPTSAMQVHLDTIMLDMAMGTDSVDLQTDKNGEYRGQAALIMAGNWQIRIELRTADGKLHEASVKVVTKS